MHTHLPSSFTLSRNFFNFFRMFIRTYFEDCLGDAINDVDRDNRCINPACQWQQVQVHEVLHK